MQETITNILLTLMTLGLLFSVKVLADKSKDLKDKVKSDRVKRAIDKAIEITTLAVHTTNQTFVQGLKDKGAFGRGEAEEAFNETKNKVLDMLDQETKKILEEEFKNSNKFLNDLIEAKVWEDKEK